MKKFPVGTKANNYEKETWWPQKNQERKIQLNNVKTAQKIIIDLKGIPGWPNYY